ncbi:hypothetical protein ACNO5E_01950 [Vibrio parahaemolyticus]
METVQKMLMNTGVSVLFCALAAGILDYLYLDERMMSIVKMGAGIGLALTIGSVILVVGEGAYNKVRSKHE